MKKTRRNRQVAILLESSTKWGREALRGIADFVREHGDWSVFVEPRGWHERLRLPPNWQGDGIIARVTTQAMADEIEAAGVPAVNLSYIPFRGPRLRQVTTDETAIGRIAAAHFLERSFRHFAYCGPPRYPAYEDRCGPAYSEAVRAAGFDCVGPVRRTGLRGGSRAGVQSRPADGTYKWLEQLPKPLAVLAWNGESGRHVIEACNAIGLHVPDDVAVLSGDDDEVMCEFSNPPLSADEHQLRRIGYEAASVLARSMTNRRVSRKPRLFQPVGIHQRQSTDVLAVDDQDVAAAVRFIREHIHMPIQVDDVLKAVPVSRRSLEYRFRRFLNRTPAEEIQRVRLQRVQLLLKTTELSVARVAELSRFNNLEVMSRLVRRELGVTPTEYRFGQ